ncbi:MAG: carboxypeptidase-like regulatory domain-containing protein, partial [Methanobacterium sp.]
MQKKLILLLIVSLFVITISGTVSAADDSGSTGGTDVSTTTDTSPDSYTLNGTSTDESNSSETSNSAGSTSQGDTSVPDPIIYGSVTHCSDNEPFAGVNITVNSMDGQLLATTITNENGMYCVGFIDSGTVFNVTASYLGHEPSTQEVTVTKNPANPNDPNFYGNVNFQLGMNEVWISPSGSDTTGTGIESNPYASLYKGIMETNSGGTLHVTSGTYTGALNRGLSITKNINIIGDGSDTTIIDAQGASRIFDIESGNTVTIEHLTLTNGKVSGTSQTGGAIWNKGGATLIINDCKFFNNQATASDGWGGAIGNDGTLNIDQSQFIGNTAGCHGGAINNHGTLTVTQ